MSRKMPDRPRKELRPVGPDQAVLNLLSKSRADLTRERPITFWLYFPTHKDMSSKKNPTAAINAWSNGSHFGNC